MPYYLRGRVIRAEDETGVPGLEVTVIDSDHQFDDLIGTTRTDADGRFSVSYTETDYAFEEASERTPEIYVRVRDRNGNTVHTDDEARPFPPSDEPSVISVDADALAGHEAEPLLWTAPDASLFPEERLAVIERAIGTAISDPGSKEYAMFRSAALCPAPDFRDLDDLIDPAFGGLRGLPAETRRFRAILDELVERGDADPPEEDFFERSWFNRVRRATAARTLAYRDLDDRPPRASVGGVDPLPRDLQLTADGDRLHAFDSATLDVATLRDAPDVERALPALRTRVDRELRDRTAIADPDGATVVFAAALAVADDADRRRDYAAVVLDQFRRLRLLTDTYEAARAVLAGDAPAESLRTAIRRGAVECGPDDGPIPFPLPVPERGPTGFGDIIAEDLWWFDCLMDAERAMRTTPRTERYTIESITPADACAGETVTITGSGFGTDPGTVVFTGQDGTIRVTPDSWSDTEIVVTLPEEARAGPVSLDIVDGTADLCGKFVVVRRRPTDDSITTFGGGRPSLSLFVTGADCVAPGETLTAWWTVRPASATDVTLDVEGVGTFDVAASGSQEFTVPTTITDPDTLDVRLDATTPCGDATTTETFVVDVVPDLSVAGIEVTQGVQQFAVGGTTNNTVPTVAEKDTVVRVYVSVDRQGFAGDTAEVTGTLRVGGTTLSPRNGSVPTSRTGRTPPSPFITAVANPDPGETDHSLNFLVPAALARGTETLRAFVSGTEVCETVPTAADSLSWTWTRNRALPVRFVRVRDGRPGGTGTSPTRAEARFTVERAFDLLPSPPTDIGPAWDDALETTENFTNLAGLGDLLDEVWFNRLSSIFAEWLDTPSDLSDVREQHHVGLTQPFCRGMGRDFASVSCVYDPSQGATAIRRIKTAHELGHSLDYDHVQVNCTGSTTPVVCPSSGCYAHPNGGAMPPNVTPFDPFWNRALNPSGQAVTDFMGYGCTRWASPDSWGRLRGDI